MGLTGPYSLQCYLPPVRGAQVHASAADCFARAVPCVFMATLSCSWPVCFKALRRRSGCRWEMGHRRQEAGGVCNLA